MATATARVPPPLPVPPRHLYRALMERLPIRYEDIFRGGGAIGPARFNAAQEVLWRHVAPLLDAQQRMRFIILKARREGVSTFFSLLITAIAALNDYVQAMVIAQDKEATQRIWAMSKLFRDQSPLRALGQVRGHTIQYRASAITLATAGSPETARSGQLTCFHGSEVAFWKDPAALVAVLQCLPRRRDVFSLGVIESTANGMAEDGALFHQEWLRACRRQTSFVPIFLPWHTFPDYTDDDATPLTLLPSDLDRYGDEARLRRELDLTWGQVRWRRQTINDDCQGSLDTWNQEYPATPEMAFIMSGHPFFRPEELVWCEPTITPGSQGTLDIVHGRITWQPQPGGPVTIFRRPEPGHAYVIGADSAMGLEGGRHSKSAAEVLDMDTLEQVAEFDAPLAPHAFAKQLALLGKVYNMALLAPEIQSSGGGGGRELLVYLQQNWGYYHLHRWIRVDRITKGQAVMYGWETNSATRPRMLSRLREHVQEQTMTLHSRSLLTQLACFGENDAGKLEALAGYDDLLMALGIALISRSENYVATRHSAPVRPEDRVDLERLGYPTQPDLASVDRHHLQRILAGQATGGGAQPQTFMEW